MRTKKFFALLLTIVFISSMFSCKSSRKKNRCNTCPTWDQVDLPQEGNE